MTSQQQQMIEIAARLGVSLQEIVDAVAIAQMGRVDLIVKLAAGEISLRAALQAARNGNGSLSEKSLPSKRQANFNR
jgi:hypothetical protein